MAQEPLPVLTELHWDLAEVASEIAAGVVPPLGFPTASSEYLRPGATCPGAGPTPPGPSAEPGHGPPPGTDR